MNSYMNILCHRYLYKYEVINFISLANIYCVKIRGYVKGVDYGLGHELTECDSTWTAVLVDGSWRLLDVYWATCHRVHSGDSSWELIDDGQSDISSLASTPRGHPKISKTEYAYNDYYFLTGCLTYQINV